MLFLVSLLVLLRQDILEDCGGNCFLCLSLNFELSNRDDLLTDLTFFSLPPVKLFRPVPLRGLIFLVFFSCLLEECALVPINLMRGFSFRFRVDIISFPPTGPSFVVKWPFYLLTGWSIAHSFFSH